MIVSFGDGFRAQAVPDDAQLSDYTSFVVGMHDRPSPTAHDGRQLGIQVRLDPLGAFSLLGFRCTSWTTEWWNSTSCWAPTPSVGRGSCATLEAGRTASRCSTVCSPAGWPPAPADLAWAWHRMQSVGGAVRISDLAVGAGCSHRQLVGLFREQIGATPKTAARVLRYARAAGLLARGDLGPARVATLCGYAEKSHLTREYAVFAGTTPGAATTMEGTAGGTG